MDLLDILLNSRGASVGCHFETKNCSSSPPIKKIFVLITTKLLQGLLSDTAKETATVALQTPQSGRCYYSMCEETHKIVKQKL